MSNLEFALSNKKLLLSLKEVASRTGLSPRTITELISAKKLKSIRVGRRRLVSLAELKRFAKHNHTTTGLKRNTKVRAYKHNKRGQTRRHGKLPLPTQRYRQHRKLPRPGLKLFRPPTTVKQYLALSAQEQDIWDRIVQVPALLKSKGWSLPRASRELNLPQELILRLAPDAFRKLPNRRIVAKTRDRLLRLLPLPSNQGLIEVFVNDSREASRVGEFWNAVALYIDKGDSSGVQQFEGDGVSDVNGQFHYLLTDLAELKRQGSFGTLRFESFYGRTAQ